MNEGELSALRARLEALETTAAFQERLLSKLDGVVLDFSGRVEALERELGQLRAAQDQPPVGPQDDPPPHY